MEELLTTKLAEMQKDLCSFFEKEIKGLRTTVDSIDSNQQFISFVKLFLNIYEKNTNSLNISKISCLTNKKYLLLPFFFFNSSLLFLSF